MSETVFREGLSRNKAVPVFEGLSRDKTVPLKGLSYEKCVLWFLEGLSPNRDSP